MEIFIVINTVNRPISICGVFKKKELAEDYINTLILNNIGYKDEYKIFNEIVEC